MGNIVDKTLYNMEWTVNGEADALTFWKLYNTIEGTIKRVTIINRIGAEEVVLGIIPMGDTGEDLEWMTVNGKDYHISSIYKMIVVYEESGEPIVEDASNIVAEFNLQVYWRGNEFDADAFWKFVESLKVSEGYLIEVVSRYSKNTIITNEIGRGSNKMLLANNINYDIATFKSIRVIKGYIGEMSESSFDAAMQMMSAGR